MSSLPAINCPGQLQYSRICHSTLLTKLKNTKTVITPKNYEIQVGILSSLFNPLLHLRSRFVWIWLKHVSGFISGFFFFPFDWCLDFLPFFTWFSFKTSHPRSTITRRQSILWLSPQYPQVSRTSHGCQLYLAPSPTSQSIICTLSPFVEAIIMMKMSKNNLCPKFTEC